MTVLSVGLGTESDAAQRAVLASVPRLFRISDGDEAPDVVVVSGRGSDWPDEVAGADGDGMRRYRAARQALRTTATEPRNRTAAVAVSSRPPGCSGRKATVTRTATLASMTMLRSAAE